MCNNIYVVFTHPPTLVSKLVSFYTKSQYTHVSVSTNINLLVMYSFGRKFTFSPFPGGFVEEKPDKGIFSFNKNIKCCITSLKVSNEQKNAINKRINYYIKNKNYSYNFLSIIGIVINKPLKCANSFFCSQFVAELLNDVGIKLTDKPNELITPINLLDNHYFKVIYKGDLKNYPYYNLNKVTFNEIGKEI